MGYALAFTGDRNRAGINPKTGKPWVDFTGAFRPEAERYSLYKQSPIAHVEVTLSESGREQRDTVVQEILAYEPSEVAFFCHGLRNSIELGYNRQIVGPLANALAEVGCSRVAFYACLTGKTDTGIAASLARAMTEFFPDVRVVAATTAGHAARNPHRRVFDGKGPGEWIVRISDPEWRAWVRRMRDANDPLRWQLLEKTRPEILKELRGE